MAENQAGEVQKARLRDAFDRVYAELRALPDAALSKINLDVPTAVGTVLGALPKIRVFRASIAEQLPKYDLARFDRLEDYALALAYAHGAYLAAGQQPRSLEELGAEALVTRDVMLADATAQSARGFVDRALIAELRSGTGYRDTAFDLVALVSLYRSNWSKVQGKTGISLAELEMAEILADRLMTAVGLREQAPPTRLAATEDRIRAFTLFLGTYEHVRRALQYIRFEEQDADAIAPSLYAGRSRRVVPEDELEPIDETEPPPLPPGNSQPMAQVGTPGSSPFTE